MKSVILVVALLMCLTGCNKQKENSTPEIQKLDIDFTSLLTQESESISSHGVRNNKLLFMVLNSKENGQLYKTEALYAYDLTSKEIQPLKKIEDTARIFDFTVLSDNSLVYSRIKRISDDDQVPFQYEIVIEKDGTEKILDSGYTFETIRLPSFFIKDDTIGYIWAKLNYVSPDKQVDKLTTDFNVIENGSVKTLWHSEAKIGSNYSVDGDQYDYVGDTARTLGNTFAFLSSKNNISTIHIYKNGKMSQFTTNDEFASAIPTENYVILSKITMSANGFDRISEYYLYDIQKEKLTKATADTESYAARALNLQNDSIIFLDDKTRTKLGNVNDDKISTKKIADELNYASNYFYVSEDTFLVHQYSNHDMVYLVTLPK